MDEHSEKAAIPPRVNEKLWLAALAYAEEQGETKRYFTQNELRQHLNIDPKTARKYLRLIAEYSTLEWRPVTTTRRQRGKPDPALYARQEPKPQSPCGG